MTKSPETGPRDPEQEKQERADKYTAGIEAYKAALLDYKSWLENQEKEGKIDTPVMAHESQMRSAFFDGMAMALGLSHQEEIAIMKGIGYVKEVPEGFPEK